MSETKKMSKTEATRIEKYHILRQVGYTSKEANLLKDHSWEKVAEYVSMQKEYFEKRNAILTKNSRTKKW